MKLSDKARQNEKYVKRKIREYDKELDLLYFPKKNFYYVSRPIRPGLEEEAGTLIQDDETVMAHAYRRGRFVVAWPISVRLMEAAEKCVQCVLRHFDSNDMTKMGASKETRVQQAVNQMNAESDAQAAKHKRHWSEERQALAREWYRENVQTRSFMGPHQIA